MLFLFEILTDDMAALYVLINEFKNHIDKQSNENDKIASPGLIL